MRYTALIALVILSVGCKAPQAFEYRDMQNFKLDSLGFDHSNISMDLVYFNPNNFGVNLRRIDCDVYVEHNYVGKFSLDTLMHIPKRAEFAIPAKMQVNMKNLFRNALSTVFAKDFLLEVKGTMRAGKAGVLLNWPFNYSAREKLTLF